MDLTRSDEAEAQLAELLSQAITIHQDLDSETRFCKICQLQFYSSTTGREQFPGHDSSCPIPHMEEVSKRWIRKEVASGLHRALKIALKYCEYLDEEGEKEIEDALEEYERNEARGV